MMPEQPKDPQALGALAPLVHAQRGRMTDLQRIQGARSLVASLGWDRAGRSDRAPWQVQSRARWIAASALLATAAVVALAVFAVHHRAARPLSFTITGAQVERNGFVEADVPATLDFADGSRVSLDRGSRASLSVVDARGARVSLTEGSVHVDIVHRPQARWLFDAGPFLISVTGTAFTFGWKPGDQELDVLMERGSVEVSGPLSDGPIALRMGQHLSVRVRQRETIIRDLSSPAPAPVLAASDSAPLLVDALAAPPSAGAPEGHPPASRAAACHGLAAQLPSGEFEAIVRQAQKAGVDACLAEAPSADLAALADAARYARHDDLARRALLAQRRRFPASAEGRDSSFLLGRLEEAEQNLSKAVAWYDAYLKQASGGTYASEALGRRMTLTQQLSGDAAARAVAAEYLARFPEGAYAARARALARTP